jgi:hypothetical protein
MANGPLAGRSWDEGEIRRLVSRMTLEQKAHGRNDPMVIARGTTP